MGPIFKNLIFNKFNGFFDVLCSFTIIVILHIELLWFRSTCCLVLSWKFSVKFVIKQHLELSTSRRINCVSKLFRKFDLVAPWNSPWIVRVFACHYLLELVSIEFFSFSPFIVTFPFKVVFIKFSNQRELIAVNLELSTLFHFFCIISGALADYNLAVIHTHKVIDFRCWI